MGKGIRIDRLFYELGAEVDDFQKGMANAEKSASKFTTYVTKHPVAAVGALTAAMAALAVQATRMAAAVETNMRKVGAAIPSAQARLKDLTHDVVELSKVTPRTAEELSAALAEIAKGTRNPDEAMKRLKASVLAADAANVDLAATYQALDTVLNAFNKSGMESETILAKLFAVSQGKAPLDELLEVLSKNGAELTRVGFGLDEAAIRMVSLFEKGVPAKQIMTQFKEESKKATGATIDAAKALQALSTAAQFTRDGTENLWKVMKNQLSAQMVELGTKILPIVNVEMKGFLGLVAQLDGTISNIKADAAVQAINAIAGAWDKLSPESRVRDMVRLRQAIEDIRKATGFTAGSATQASELRTRFSDDQIRAYLKALKVLRQAEGEGAVGASLMADVQGEFDRRRLGDVRTTEFRLNKATVSAPVDPEIQKKRDSMIAEAQDALAKMSGSLAVQVELEMKRIVERAHEVFGTQLPAEVEDWIQRIREQFEANQIFESFSNGFKELVAESEAGAEALRGGYAGAIADATVKLRGLQGLIQDELATAEMTTEERQRLKVLLAQIEAQLNKNAAAAGASVQSAEDETVARVKQIQQAVELGRKIENVARGVLDLADAWGLADERSTKVLENAVQLAASLPSAMKGDPTSIVSALGAAVSLVSSIVGGGASPEEKARRQVLEANTEALRALRSQFGEFGLNVTGQAFGTFTSTASAALAAGQKAFNGHVRGPGGFVDLIRQAEAQKAIGNAILGAGLSLKEFADLAKELGISFAGAVPTLQEMQQVAEAIAATELTKFAETFTGQLQALRAEFELFDISDPIAQLKKLVDLFNDPSFGAPALRQALAGLDLASPEGRAAAKDAIQSLFRQLQNGTLTADGLGGLTAEELLEQILQVNQLLGGAAQASGTTNQFAVERKATEVQFDRSLALQTTGVAILTEMLATQQAMRDYLASLVLSPVNLQPPPLASLAGMAPATSVQLTLAPGAIVIQVGAGTDPNAISQTLASTLGDLIMGAVETRSRNRDAAVGQPILS